MKYFFVFLTMVSPFLAVAPEGVEKEQQLLDLIKSNLTSHMAPTDLQENTVRIYLDLYQIVDVDEKNSMWTVRLWVFYYYFVPSVEWDPEFYGGRTKMTFPKETFWTPDIVMQDMIQPLSATTEQQIVFSPGLVAAWSSQTTVKLSCHFDVTAFPYDEQKCSIKFTPWSSGQEYNLRIAINSSTGSIDAALEHYREHDQWDLKRPVVVEEIEGENGYDDSVIMNVYLKRRPSFYFNILLFPNLVLYALSALVFMIPVECGEKVSFAVTLMLTQMVTFATLSEIFPESSRGFPAIALFACVVTTHMAVICLLVVIVVNLHFMGDSRKPGYLVRKLTSCRFLWFIGLQPHRSHGAFSQNNNPTEAVPLSTQNKPQTSLDLLDENQTQSVAEDSDENMWRSFAQLVDRGALFIHIIVQAGFIIELYMRLGTA